MNVGALVFILMMCCMSSSVAAYVGYEYTQGNLGGEKQKEVEEAKKIADLQTLIGYAIVDEECNKDVYYETKDKTYADLGLGKDYENKVNQFNKLCKYEGYKDLGALSTSDFKGMLRSWRQDNIE